MATTTPATTTTSSPKPIIVDKSEQEKKKSKGAKVILWILLAIGLFAFIWWIWPKRQEVPQSASASTLLSVHAGNACRDKFGKQVAFDYASRSDTDFDIYVPPGCDTLVAPPKVYGYHWYVGLADDPDAHRYVYFKEQGASQYRLYDLSSESNADMGSQSLRIYFQSAEKGGTKVHFHTDLEPVKLEKAALDSTTKDGLVTDPVPSGLASKAPCTPEAKRANFSGNAYVSFIVDEDGNPKDVKLTKPTGILSLDANVIETAKRYRFKPAMQSGHPVPFSYSEVEVQIENCQE
jgi:TonB family protein